MASRWNQIFTAGIVWDPQEPLPVELQGYDHGIIRGRSVNLSAAAARVDDNVKFLDGRNAGTGLQATATWPIAAPSTREDRLPRYTVQEQGRNVLPPLSVTVDASIVQDTARVTVTQLFWNDSSIPIKEAAFTFPLPTGCTVTDFSCRVGTNTIIRGTVKPREEARETFEHHIRHRDTAAGLLEQDTPEIFTTTLGNIPEKTKVKVNLTYITILKHRFADSKNVTTLTIPTSIAPRYGDAPEEYNNAATKDIRQGLTLEVEVVKAEQITSITSPSHAIATERRRGARNAESFADLAGENGRSKVETASVKLESGSMFLDKDFVLDIATKSAGGAENPQAWLEQHPTMPNHKALMLTLPPGFLTKSAAPMQRSEILFLADRSGSMSDKIASLKSAMQFFLKGIPEGRRFNIWCFGTDYTSWQPRSVDYTKKTLKSALTWVDQQFAANMGGTELLPAIKAIVGARDKSLMTDVIVLTDGETWRLDQTLDFIQKTRGTTEGRVRFFALGIGKAVSHALVDGIAKAGGGYADVVQEASQGGWEDRVVSMAKAALMSAHAGPLHLDFDIRDENGTTRSSTLADAKRSPADISAINPFDRSRVYFLLDSIQESETIATVKVQITANHDIQSLVIPVSVLEKRDTTLHKLAARSMLDDLERSRSHIHLGLNRPVPGSWEESNMVRKEAEEIACKWSLVSKWTSFFLAEEPYSPTGDDAAMDGIIEVKDAPGDDLLQPRGPIQEDLVSWVSDHALQTGQAAGSVSPPGSSTQSTHRQLIGSMVTQEDRSSKRSATTRYYRIPSGPPDVTMNRRLAPPPPQRPPFAFGRPSREALAIATPQGSSSSSVPARAKAEMQAVRAAPESATTMSASSIYVPISEDWSDFDSISLPASTGMASRMRTITGASDSSHLVCLGSDANEDRWGKMRKMVPKKVRATPRWKASANQHRDPVLPLKEGKPVSVSTTTEEGMDERLYSSVKTEYGLPSYRSQPRRPTLPVPVRSMLDIDEGHDWEGLMLRKIRKPFNDVPEKAPAREERTSPAAGASEDDNDQQREQAERAFVTTILQFQSHDGSIHLLDWETAKQVLGKDIADALCSITHAAWPDVALEVLWTVAVRVLLERDFQSCKALWELMVLKMEVYCEKNLGDLPTHENLLREVQELLKDQKLPIHQLQDEQVKDGAGQDEGKKGEAQQDEGKQDERKQDERKQDEGNQDEEKQDEKQQDEKQQDEKQQDEVVVASQAPKVVAVETATPEPGPDKGLLRKRRKPYQEPRSPTVSKAGEEKKRKPGKEASPGRIPAWMTPWKRSRKAKVTEPVVRRKGSSVSVAGSFDGGDDGISNESPATVAVSERSRRRRTFHF